MILCPWPERESYMLTAESAPRHPWMLDQFAAGVVTPKPRWFDVFALMMRERDGWASKAWTVRGMLPWDYDRRWTP